MEGRRERKGEEKGRELMGLPSCADALWSRMEVKCIQCYGEEFIGRRASQIGLQKTKMHCIEILGPGEVIGDAHV
jgi:hypothetical protein